MPSLSLLEPFPLNPSSKYNMMSLYIDRVWIIFKDTVQSSATGMAIQTFVYSLITMSERLVHKTVIILPFHHISKDAESSGQFRSSSDVLRFSKHVLVFSLLDDIFLLQNSNIDIWSDFMKILSPSSNDKISSSQSNIAFTEEN